MHVIFRKRVNLDAKAVNMSLTLRNKAVYEDARIRGVEKFFLYSIHVSMILTKNSATLHGLQGHSDLLNTNKLNTK